MYAHSLGVVAVVAALLNLLGKPIVEYFWNKKGLRAYPNYNILCGISNIGWCLETWKGGIRSKELSKMHKTHPVIRIGPNSLSYGDIDALKDIYGHGTKCNKDMFYDVQHGSHYNIGDVIDKKHHLEKRKMVSSAFALKNLEEWEYKVAEKVSAFITACDRHCTPPLAKAGMRPDLADLTFDYRTWSNLLTIDAIADIALSERLELLEQGSDALNAETLDGQIRRVKFGDCLHSIKLAQTRIVYADKWFSFNSDFSTWLIPSYRRLWKTGREWGNIVYHLASKRLARYQSGEQLDDFFQSLMEDNHGKPHGLEWGEIVAEVGVMLDAGSDTTAVAMNNTIFWLLKEPACWNRLKEEVDTALDPEDVVAPYDKVKHLPYLRACIDETLSITPSFSYNLPRRTPPEGTYILGKFVPGNTSISMSAYVAHRDEKYFPNPEKFIPDRWLGEDSRKLQAAFVPFSAGARGCIGRNLSYLEQTVLLASVVHRYEFALPYPSWEQDRIEVTNLLPGPLPLKAWMRQDVPRYSVGD